MTNSKVATQGTDADPEIDVAPGRAVMWCDFCSAELTDQWIDGATRYGPWATMCAACHASYGVGLGPGRGQRFDVPTGKKLEG